MSTELAIQNDLGMSLAEAIGVSSSGGEKKSVSLPRVTIIHNGIMVTKQKENGRATKEEVVPAGSYKITQGEDNVVYSINPSIRIFAVRQQWSKWNVNEDKMMKTVMSTDLKGDLKDNMGGFNLGRPAGFIEDWGSLDENTQNFIKSIKRKKILFGMLTANDCIDEAGNPVSAITDPVPFVFEVPPSSTKAVTNALSSLARKNILPIQYIFNLDAGEGTLPNGNPFSIIKFNPGEKVDITPEDQDILKNFMEYIEYQNAYILSQWEEKNQETISEADADIVAEFVNVEEAD